MISSLHRFTIETTRDCEVFNVTPKMHEVVAASGVEQGIVYVTTLHTTTGITVNEGLEDIEHDLMAMLERLAPAEDPSYRHARFLRSDGAMAVNSHCHQRSALLGLQVAFPVDAGKAVLGKRQTIYFVELDGPLQRGYMIHVLGTGATNQEA
jgi:secondary thiamine-phosphate synthase enzyme